jgi:hypothetical protein
MMQIQISPSDKKEKKFKATIDKKRTVYFGSQGASDFTLHKDEARKQRYIDRHRKNEDWSDPSTAGFYAKHLLWNKPTIQEAIKDTNRRFKNISISFKRGG